MKGMSPLTAITLAVETQEIMNEVNKIPKETREQNHLAETITSVILCIGFCALFPMLGVAVVIGGLISWANKKSKIKY